MILLWSTILVRVSIQFLFLSAGGKDFRVRVSLVTYMCKS